MRRPTTLRRPIALRLLAAAWALVVAAGALEIHGAEPAWSHEPSALGDARIFLCDSGHQVPLHVEAARAVEREHCPGCLHRLQVGGGHLAAAPAFASPGFADGIDLPRAPHVAFAPGHSGGSRAPPAS